MAEYTIKHDITDKSSSSGGGGRSSKALDETKLAAKIGKVYEKVAKDANSSLAKNLNKELDKVLTKLVREMIRHQPGGGGASGGGVSKQEIGRIVKEATKTVSVDAANSLLKELQKIKPGQAGNSRELESIFKSMDRKIGGMAGAINTALSKANVELSPQGVKILSDAISASLRGAVSKEFGTAIKDFNKTVESLSRGLDATNKALESFSRLKKSGGGIDIKEVPQAIKSVGNVAREFKNVNNDFTALNRSVKTLVSDQKAIMKDVADAVIEMKKSVSQKVQSVTQTTPNLIDAKKWPKIFDDFLSRYEKITKSIKLDVKSAGGSLAPPRKEIKQLEVTTKETNKKIDNLSKTVERVYKDARKVTGPGGGTDNTARNVDTLFKEISKLIGEIRKQSRAKGDTIAKEVKADTKDVKLLENFRSERKELIKAFDSGQPERIKEKAGRGLSGVDPKLTHDLRSLVNTVERLLEKSTQAKDKSDVDNTFIEKLKNSITSSTANAATEAVEKALSKSSKIQPTSPQKSEMGPIIENIKQLNSKLRGPQTINVYPEKAIPATKGGFDPQFEIAPTKGQAKQQQIIKNRIQDLSSSLVDLQDYIVETVDKEFKDAGSRWAVVREGTEKSNQEFFKLVKGGNTKTAGKQYAFEIADVETLKRKLFTKGRGAATKGTSASIVKEMIDVISTESASNLKSPSVGVDRIAKWLKNVTEEQIRGIEEIQTISNKLIDIKKLDVKGVLPTEDIKKRLTKLLVDDRNTLQTVFKVTVGRAEATKSLREDKLLRKVAIPAARLTKSGTPVFETSKGSQRALQKFATFKTGFENLYEDLAEQQALTYSKGYAEKIKGVGVRPTGLKLDAANKLAEDILTDFAAVNINNFEAFRKQIGSAALVKKSKLSGANQEKLSTGVKGALAVNLNEQLQPGDLKAASDELIKAMKEAGLSAYDVVKSLDTLEFENVYDIMLKVLRGKEGQFEPIKNLAQNPKYDKGIRQVETASRQVESSLPLVEPGRPRRAFQQGNVLNLLTRSSDVYAGEKPTDLKPADQLKYIKDLNVRLNELVKESRVKHEDPNRISEQGIRAISTLGLTEATSAKVDFYRPGYTSRGTEHLGALDAVSTKMSTDIIGELAPLGAQFNNLGKNISATTMAMESSKDELDRLAKEFGATTLEGYGTEFPTLRSGRESELIESGKFGSKGYGFNVITELRHTAGTMEDQILVSGNLQKALTSVTKTLVKPSPAGRLGSSLEGTIGVGEVQTGTIKDIDIKNVLDKMQDVLGVPDKYKGRADQAFIEEVKRAITVVRGEDIEVQQARITEVFLNKFGRKFITRYGSKGVSVTPGGLTEESASSALDIIQKFPDAKVKVLTDKERESAGLGVALLPRSMGELLSEVLDKYEKQLTSEGFDVGDIKAMLIASGNKFVFELFKNAEQGLVVEGEAATQQKTFQQAAEVFKSISGKDLSGDRSAIQEIRNLFKKEVGGGVFKERAIDVRISSTGVAKRGLQPEVLESVINNIAGVGERGSTTIPTRLGQSAYESLLGQSKPGGGRTRGELSKASKSLGFKTVGTTADIQGFAEDIGRSKAGTAPEDAAYRDLITMRAKAIEEESSYYTTVIDEFGKERKSLVGTKFLSIIEETGQTEGWSPKDIRRGKKGASIDLPALSAYANVFGENSALLDEILNTTNANQRKHLEFLKALQFMADETGTLQDRQLEFLESVDINAVKQFDAQTGVLSQGADAKGPSLDPRNLEGTIFDVKKFPKPFSIDIPKAGGDPKETEPFYVPGALARGTYSEELVAGERGIENTGRRLQQVVNTAKRASELLDRPATLQAEIDQLEVELEELIRADDPRAAQKQTLLSSRQIVQDRLLSGEGEIPQTITRRVTEKIAEQLQKAQKLKYQKTPESTTELSGILDFLKGALSTSEAPAEAFQIKKFAPGQAALPLGSSEAANVDSFLERQLKTAKTQNFAFADAIGKASDILIGKGPSAQDAYNTILQGIAEIKRGELENIESFRDVLKKDFRFRDAAEKTTDSGEILGLLQSKQVLAQNEMKATEDKLYRLAEEIRGGRGLELAAKLDLNIDSELQVKYEKALDNLQKAKIDYFQTLATSAIGKEGSIGTAVFSRKFPAVMKKAVVAITNKTEDFAKFRDSIKALQVDLPEADQDKLSGVLSEVDTLSSEHQKKIATQIKAGFPVLKQHELGIPTVTAKKLPASFARRFEFSEETVEFLGKEIEASEGTLFDLLTYVNNLRSLVDDNIKNIKTPSGDSAAGLGKYIFEDRDQASAIKQLAGEELEQTNPYVETLRYPFTGVSSLVPYEAKLLEGKQNRDASNAFVVPGVPDFNINEFNANIKDPVEGIIASLHQQREAIFKSADTTTGGVLTAGQDQEVDRLTGLMDKLAKAVFDVTPRYSAHTQKLDFDGDAISVHTAETKKAREEIRAHYKTVAEFGTGLQEVYRDFFTADTVKSLSPVGAPILAEMQETFIKKFGEGQTFDYLIKPFVTGQAVAGEETPTLEYANRAEKLSIAGLGGGDIRRSLEEAFTDSVSGLEISDTIRDRLTNAIASVESEFKSVEDEANAIKDKGGLSKRLKFSESLFTALDKADQELGTSYSKQIESAITDRVFNSKFQAAVEQQLAKVQAGIQVEGLYRIGKLTESNLGFGAGFAGTGKGGPGPSEDFLSRNPALDITGGGPQDVLDDYYAKFGETFRFAFQQGQDVKKGGGASVATELVTNLSRGAQGVEDLWSMIIDESEKDYDQLRDFSDIIGKTTSQRLGEMPTNDIREELTQLYEARGTEYSPAELAKSDRDAIVKKVLEATGLKSFLTELSTQVQEAAIEGIVKQVSQYSPERRGRIGDPLSFAKGKVQEEIAEGGINIREHITTPQLPLYAIRSEKGLPNQRRRFKEKYGDPTVPDSVKFLRKDSKETEELLDKYREAKATAQNIQDAFNDAIESGDRGAYGKLVASTIDNINRDQKRIESEFGKLKSEGFYPRDQLAPKYMENLINRVSDVEKKGLPSITKDILDKLPADQVKELEELADLSGVPTLTREEKADVKTGVLGEFRKRAEKLYAKDPDLTLEQINEKAEAYAEQAAEAATVVYEMDRILAVLSVRAKEGITIASVFPTLGSTGGAPATGGARSNEFTSRMQSIASDNQQKRDAQRNLYGPDKGGTIGGGGAGIAALFGGGTGGVVPVHIHSVAEGVGTMFGGGQAMPSGPGLMEHLNPAFKPQEEALKVQESMSSIFNQHGEAAIRKIQARIKKEFKNVESGFDRHKGRFDDEKFKEIQDSFFPDVDPRDYEELKREFFTTKLKTFTGSGFKGGGTGVSAVLKDFKEPGVGHRRESQIEGILENILGAESDYTPGKPKKLDFATQSAFDIGTALHAKMQKKIAGDMKSIGKEVDIEKFVHLNPQEFIKDIEGPITGFIDVAYKNTKGEINKISDIKTTGETFAKFETISKLIPEGTIELDKLLNQEIPGHVRQKLEEYRSQLNVYLAALIQGSKREGGSSIVDPSQLEAQIDFIPSEDRGLKTPPKSITFKFDESRLQEDLEALQAAREIVTKYIHNLDTETADVPEEHRDVVAKFRKRVSGKTPAAARARTLKSFQLEEELDKRFGVIEQSDKFINDFVELSGKTYDFSQGKKNVYKEVESNYKKATAQPGQFAEGVHTPPDIDPSKYAGIGPSPEQRTASKARVKSFPEPLKDQFAAIRSFHKGSVAIQTELSKLDFNTVLDKLHVEIQETLRGDPGAAPPTGPQFSGLLEKLTEGDNITFDDSMKAWRLWRVAMGDFLIQRADEAEAEFDLAKDEGTATREFGVFKERVTKIRDFIVQSLGKRTDIYTKDRRFLLPEQAEDAGVYASPKQLFEQTKAPFEDDEFTRGVYKDFLDNLDAGTLGAPADEIKKIAESLAEVDKEAERVLSDIDLFARKGEDATEAWDFATMTKRARNFREALTQYAQLNLSDDFQVDVEKKFQVRSLLQYLKQIEQVYGRIDLDKVQKGPYGRLETGAIKVPGFLPPGQQEALNRRNLQKFRDFGKRPEDEGGPQIGESFSLFQKVTDSAGNVLKSTRTDFKKYGEVIDENDEKVGKFSETQTDLIDKMHMSGGTFRSATRRVIMWGAAASLVYGGVQQLKDSLGELADIEVSIAQLRMVMNPLDTDFDKLTASAVGFAKTYGVGINEVLRSMKIFAQQGLSQSEVIDRTRVSTLAANVSTLSAGDATEALTAAMKVFGNEIGSADMALDAWSETEARHAITAADMANAIKKSAAAAKNAGFTFNELNGIVAGIGAVTRQTGKEVGTAMRFIARRLFSEKGPSALADIGIPTVTGTGENRRGFDVLSDLSMQWEELTNAQKLNIAQSLGGTRQYNALLVAMDNWNEVLDAIEDSTNSKGSAERRNVEIMKTYAKQLEQTKAAAGELKIQLGGFIFPIFKTGLKGLKILFELMSSIPGPVKAAGVALGLFFTYAAKGLSVFDGALETFNKGSSAIGNFANSIKEEFAKAKFEVLGKGFGPDVEGLKTFAKGSPIDLKATGLGDLHSGFGKLTYLIKSAGDQYNEFLSDVGSSSGDFGKGLEAFGKKFKNTAKIIDLSTDLFQFLGLSTAPWVSVGTQIVESLAKGTGYAVEKSGQLFGKSGEVVAQFFADTDPGLFKSIAPLALTIGSMGLALKSTASALDRTRKSAQDYAQSVYNARRIEEDQIKSLTNTVRQYDKLEQRLKKVDKVLKTPGLKENQQASDNYTSPILALADIQSDATKLGNELANINNKLVIGYDEQGDAILRLTGNYKSYIEALQRSSSLELAKTDIDVLKKFSESLTDTGLGETIKQTLKTTLGEVPGFGGILSDLVAVSPGKEMETITGQLNDLLSLREEYPLSDAFDQDIDKLQEALSKVKKIYDTTVTDFKRTLAGIFKFEGAQNLDRDTIANLLGDPGLTKGFELLLEVEPKIAEVNKTRLSEKVSTEDIIGSEILKRIFPQKKAVIDYTSELTAAQIESAGIVAREGKKVASGDVVTFFPEMAKVYKIAGAQAVVELKKTTDGVYEAFITYINSKTLKVEERALDDPDLMRMVDRIFPAGRVQMELESRLDALNTFVAGAGAGLTAIDAKKFKKDFDLGARFYSELPTTTALQSDQGFNVQTGGFGALPQLQQEWARMTKTFFIEPMSVYNREVESLNKNTLDGLGESANLTKQKADELFDQQSILRNNQVVVQFAAVFADLAKSMEESSRVLKENVAVEKSRQESVRVTTGLMKGLPEGFDAVDTGIRKVADLSSKQIAALNNPEYRRLAGQARVQQVSREGAIGQLDALEKAKVAIETIVATQGGFGSIVGPEAGPKAVEGFIQKAVAVQDVGMATLSYDINNLDTTSRKGFGEVVDRLETMIANQGDLSGYSDKVDDLAKRAAGPLNARGAELLGGKIATEMQGIAGVRETLRGRGDQRGVGIASAYLDQLTDILVQVRGVSGGTEDIEKFGKFPGPLGYLPPANKFEISPEEFQQRAFRNLQPNELTERFRTEGKASFGGEGSLFDPKRVLSALSPEYREEFSQSGEYKDLLDVQKDSKKIQEKSFLDAKTILKGSVAIATFEAFNKKHSSKVLDNLKEQLTTAETGYAEANKAGTATPEQEKSVASLRQAVSEQESNLRFHSVVSAMTKITGTTTALGKVLGVSETALKRVNVGAVGLYVAMQAASKVTGKDLPESAKEFGGVLKEAVGELKEGDLKYDTVKTLKNAGKKFEDAYGERVKDATGKTREAIDKEIKTRLAGMKDLSAAEIDARAKDLRKQAGSEGGAGIKALIAALSAATIAGAAYEITGRGTANAERERIAERQSAIFNSIVEKYPEAADAIAKELVKQVQDRSDAVAKAVVDTAPENQLLDIRKEEIKAYEFLDESINKTKKTIEETSGAFDELADQMAKFELIADLNKATADFIRTLSAAATEFEVRRNFGGSAVLNESLKGFAGDAELPIQTNQLSTQQRLFTTMGDDFQNSVTSYSYGLQTVSTLVDRLSDSTKRRAEFIENNIEDPEIWKSLEGEIDSTKEAIKNATDTLRPFGEALSNMVQYADSINKLNTALDDISAKQAVETLPGFRQFRDDMDKMLGGAHPDSVVGISPEQEREGRSVGVQLRQFESTKYDVERVKLLKQLKTAEGAEGSRIALQLRDLPERRRRDIETYRQRTADRSLQEQQQPFTQALTDVQRLRQGRKPTPGFFGLGDDDVEEGLKDYQNSIVEMLRRSSEKVSREDLLKEVEDAGTKPIFGLFGKAKLSEQQVKDESQRIKESGPQQYRGTLLTGRAGIEDRQREVFEELRRQMPTRDMSELKVAIAEPIVRELETQTNILKVIAEQGFDIDAAQLKAITGVVAPFEAEKFKAPKKGFFDRIFENDYAPKFQKAGIGAQSPATQRAPAAFGSGGRDRPLVNDGGGTAPAVSSTPEWYQDYYRWVTEKFGYKPELKNTGGQLFGPGGPKEDKIPAMLSPGEYVVKTSSAKKLGYGALEHMNEYGELPKFADGGGVSFRDTVNMTGSGLLDIAGQLSSYADPLIEEAMKEQLSSKGVSVGAFLKHAGLSVADIAGTFAGSLVGALGLGVKGAANIDNILGTAVKGQNKETYSKFFEDFGELSSAAGTAGSEYITGGGLEESYKSGELFRNIAAGALDFLAGSEAVKGGLKLADVGSKTAIKKASGKALASVTKPLRNQRGTLGESVKIGGKTLDELTPDDLLKLPQTELAKVPIEDRARIMFKGQGVSEEQIVKGVSSLKDNIKKETARVAEINAAVPGTTTVGKAVKDTNFVDVTLEDLNVPTSLSQLGIEDVRSLGKIGELLPKDVKATSLGELLPFAEPANVEEMARVMGRLVENSPAAVNRFSEIDFGGPAASTNKSVLGTFFHLTDLDEAITRPKPTSLTLAQDLLMDPKQLKNIEKVLTHEIAGHGQTTLVKEKALVDLATSGSAKNIKNLKILKKYEDTIAQSKPVSDYSRDAKKLWMDSVDAGDSIDVINKHRSTYISEQQAELSALVGIYDNTPGNLKTKAGRLKESGFYGTALKSVVDDDELIRNTRKIGETSFLKTKGDLSVAKFAEGGSINRYGMGGMSKKRKHYADGGPARRFTTINGELVEVDSDGNIVKSLGKSADSREGFLRNKAYQVGIGEVDAVEANKSPQAMFAEESASLTGRRFGMEATELHRARQKPSEAEMKAAAEGKFQRQRRRDIADTDSVGRMLRFPGIDQQPGDEATRKAYGLKKLEFDKRRGVVSYDSLPGGRTSYHDLDEIKYQDLKRAIAEGKVNKPTVAAGFRATAGTDPVYKAQLEKAKKDRENLEPLWGLQPNDPNAKKLGQVYGREAELVWPIWRKLLNSEFEGNEEIQKYKDQTLSLLEAIDTGKRLSADNVKSMTQLVEADREGEFLSSGKGSQITNEAMKMALGQAELGKDKDLLSGPTASEQIKTTRALLSAEKRLSKSAGDEANEKARQDLKAFAFDSALRAITPGMQLIRDLFGKADGGSMPFFQAGGPVTQSGPIYAHKGEFVVPKGFADGGLVTSDIGDAALKEGTIKLEDNGLADMIADKIKDAIESTEVKVDQDAVVKVDVVDVSVPVDIGDAMVGVDTTDVTVSVDTEGVLIPINTGAAAAELGKAIAEAVSGATVDVNVSQAGGAAIGADAVNELSRTIQSVDDRVIEVKDNLDTRIETVRNETLSAVQSEIASQINNALNRIQHDVNEHRNDISSFNSQLRQLDHQYDHRIREVDRLAKDAQNLAQRPTSSLTLT